jgi:hypothetical protein
MLVLQLDKWLIECARKLNDGNILAVLNGGDVVAQYLYFCLTALCNKERAYLLTIGLPISFIVYSFCTLSKKALTS